MSKEVKHSELIGPFVSPKYYIPTVDGYKVPNIKIIKKTGADDGKVEVHLDERYVYIISDSELDTIIHLVANAMAISAGYSCCGENSVYKPNPFKCRMTGI